MKRLSISVDLEDPTPERIQTIIAGWAESLKGKIRRTDTPTISVEDAE